ncbi:MAG: HesB/YadR/YfhF family protein [Bacillota bacterium]|nr:HesB/YadR/YfhF family protein [Bacillota bacterium]
MKITISEEAANWYQTEMNLASGNYVRFFVRYGGCSTVQSGFSLGVSNEEPVDLGVGTEKNGITFYIEEKDLWYFDQHDLSVDFNKKHSEPVFDYKK